MLRLLFHLLFCIIIIGCFPNNVFADEDSEQVDSEKSTSSGNDEKTSEHVRSIVDSLLKINKHVEPSPKDPKIQKLMKERGIGAQINKLRKDLDNLNKTLNKHRETFEVDTTSDIKGAKSSTHKESSNKPHKKNLHTKRKNSYKKFSSFQSKRKIYTIKSIDLSTNATNRYLNQLGSLHKIKSYEKQLNRSYSSPMEYKIRSFGNSESNNSSLESRKLTIKSRNYFGDKSKCQSLFGCD